MVQAVSFKTPLPIKTFTCFNFYYLIIAAHSCQHLLSLEAKLHGLLKSTYVALYLILRLDFKNKLNQLSCLQPYSDRSGRSGNFVLNIY